MPDMPLINGDPNSMPAPDGGPLPSVAGPGPTNPLADAPEIGGPLELTPEQLTALNLDGLAPGDTQTIVLKAQDAPEGGPPTFEVVSSEPVVGEPPSANDQAPENGEEAPSPEGEEDAPPAEGDDMAGGFKRKKKTPRVGLPDTKKMREL